MTVEKPKPKQLLRPITTGAGSAMNQSQFLAITCNSLEARERSRVHGAIGFGLASHWLKNWRESFKPITKRSNRNHGITFDSHLKTALYFATDPVKKRSTIVFERDFFETHTHLLSSASIFLSFSLATCSSFLLAPFDSSSLPEKKKRFP